MAEENILIEITLDSQKFQAELKRIPNLIQNALGKGASVTGASSSIKQVTADLKDLASNIERNPINTWAAKRERDFTTAKKALTPLINEINRLGLARFVSERSQSELNQVIRMAGELGLKIKAITDAEKAVTQALKDQNTQRDKATSKAERLQAAEDKKKQHIAAKNDLDTQNDIQRTKTLDHFGGTGTAATLAGMQRVKQSYGELMQALSRMGPAGFERAFGPETLKKMTGLFEAAGQKMPSFPNFFTNMIGQFGRHLGQWALLIITIEAAQEAIKLYNESVHKSAEMQVQGVLFNSNERIRRNSGQPVDGTTSKDVQNKAMRLAMQYGDEVNDVVQDLNLWYKATGNLNSGLYLTNETLKFQLATGTKVEDLYKTLTALSSQAVHIPFSQGDKNGFTLAQTPELLNAVFAAASVAGAGMRQLGKNGEEATGSINNSAITLLTAIDKDTAALGQMGYSMKDIVALNQSLIRSFGNNGAAASDAADKIGRLAGGLAGLSKPDTKILKAFKKENIDLSPVLNTKVGADGVGMLERLGAQFDKLDQKHKNYLATQITGNRQYEALFAILEGLGGKTEILAAIQKNKNGLDETAIELMGTYQIAQERSNAAWEVLGITIATQVLPALTEFFNWTGDYLIPRLAEIADNLGSVFSLMGNVGKGLSNRAMESGLVADSVQHPEHAFENWRLIQQAEKEGNANAEDTQKNLDKYRRLGTRDYVAPEITGFDRKKNKPIFGNKNRTYANAEIYYEAEHGTTDAFATTSDARGKKKFEISPDEDAKAKADLAKWKSFVRGAENTAGDVSPGNVRRGGGPSAAALENNAMQDELAIYDDLIERKRQDVEMSDTQLRHAEKLIKTNGLDANTQKALAVAMHQKNYAILAEEDAIRQKMAVLEKNEALDKKHANAISGRDSKDPKVKGAANRAFLEYDKNARTAEKGVRALRLEIARLNAELDRNQDTVDESNSKRLQSDYRTFTGGQDATIKSSEADINNAVGLGTKADEIQNFKATFEDFIQKRKNFANDFSKSGLTGDNLKNELTAIDAVSQEWTDRLKGYLKTNTEAIRSFKEELTSSTASASAKGLESLLGMSGFKPQDEKYYKTILSLKSQSAQIQKQYEADKLKASGSPDLKAEVEYWHDTELATLGAESAVAKFTQRLEALKDSQWYKSVEAAFTELGNSISATIEQKMFGSTGANNPNLRQYNQQLQSLASIKTSEDLIFNSKVYHSAEETAMHNIRLQQYDIQIKKQEQLKKQQEDRNANPSLIKKLAQSFTKGVVDDFLKKAQESAIKSLFHLDPDDKLQKVIKDQIEHNTSKLIPSMDGWKEAAIVLAGALDRSTKAFTAVPVKTDTYDNVGNGRGGILGTGSALAATGSLFSPSSALSNGLQLIGAGAGIQIAFANNANSADGSGYNPNLDGTGAASDAFAAFASSVGKQSNGFDKSRIGKGLGGAAAAYAGYQQGGITGGIETYGGVLSMIQSNAPHFGPWGYAIAGAAGLVSAFSHKDVPANMPDKYDTANFTQNVGELQGSAGTGYGPAYNASTDALQQSLGGKPMLAYIEDYIAANLNSTDKNKRELAQSLDAQYGHTGGGKLAFDKNIGQESVVGGTLKGDYNSLHDSAQQAVSQIQALGNASAAAAQQALVGLNQYGGGGFLPYSWNTPGYAFPDPGSVGVTSSTMLTSAGANAANNPNTAGAKGGGFIPDKTPVVVKLDGRVIARSNQSYQQQAYSAGYTGVP